VTVPMTREMAAALRTAPKLRDPEALCFPSCRHNPTRDKLPVFGHGLRHTDRTVAADLGIDEVVVRLLTGHSLQGVSQAYIAKAALSGGMSMREAQKRISKRIVALLGIE
jgi:integrase